MALQLPVQLPDGVAKPYFLFGDAQNPVDLWFLDLSESRVRQFVGRGTEALNPLGGREIEGRAAWAGGEWSAIFVRELRSAGSVSFAPGQYVPVAFSLWDGTARERGNRRGLTQWTYVHLLPREKPSVVGPMARAGLGVLGLELLVVLWIRRRARATATIFVTSPASAIAAPSSTQFQTESSGASASSACRSSIHFWKPSAGGW